jgi:hypothetical protein
MTKVLKNQPLEGGAALTRKQYKPRPRSFWVEFVESCRRSKLSAKKFCELKGVGYSTFAKWQKLLREEVDKSDGKFIQMELEVSDTTVTSSIPPTSRGQAPPELQLKISQGLILLIPKGFDSITLRQVLKALS